MLYEVITKTYCARLIFYAGIHQLSPKVEYLQCSIAINLNNGATTKLCFKIKIVKYHKIKINKAFHEKHALLLGTGHHVCPRYIIQKID